MTPDAVPHPRPVSADGMPAPCEVNGVPPPGVSVDAGDGSAGGGPVPVPHTVAALSHDIRTPLAAIALNAELVMRRAEVPAMQQAAQRLKSAVGLLSRQIDHLVKLALPDSVVLASCCVPGDLPALLAQRLQAALPRAWARGEATLRVEGPAEAEFDPLLMASAIDGLLHILAPLCIGSTLTVEVDGHARRLLLVRFCTPILLSDAQQAEVFGDADSQAGLAARRVGPGLRAIDLVVRSQGGSLIGHSREREGTLFEILLPRKAAP